MAYCHSHKNIIPYWLLLLLLLVVTSVSKPISTHQKIPAVIVFGDSSVDSGNNNFIPTIARSNFKPYGRDFLGGFPTGRFCNGRLPSDFISEGVGLKPIVPAYLDPAYNISDFAYGVCFASAGYIGDEKAEVIISEALYLVSIGTNDFLENYYALPKRQKEFSKVSEYEDFLIGLAWNFVKELYFLGARKISLAGVPPMGCLPLQRATNILEDHACAEDKNSVAREFNMKLITLVANLNKFFPGLQIVYSDAYTVFLDIITSPSKYGFEEAEVGCCGTGTFEMSFLCNKHNPFTCPDANKYVFWDAFHPSQKTAQIISHTLLKTSLAKFAANLASSVFSYSSMDLKSSEKLPFPKPPQPPFWYSFPLSSHELEPTQPTSLPHLPKRIKYVIASQSQVLNPRPFVVLQKCLNLTLPFRSVHRLVHRNKYRLVVIGQNNRIESALTRPNVLRSELSELMKTRESLHVRNRCHQFVHVSHSVVQPSDSEI
ncbi:hypothetical protein G4B88_007264 [Cannabis sativa]|uniref:GDSL esterase/lipase n=1 Tax=Cannabis sativa TaxID=3483 RepID=A0A7J6FR96_CANSA|nr:hypothetical protein G4B88_007264 [Cannabis sativa]